MPGDELRQRDEADQRASQQRGAAQQPHAPGPPQGEAGDEKIEHRGGEEGHPPVVKGVAFETGVERGEEPDDQQQEDESVEIASIGYWILDSSPAAFQYPIPNIQYPTSHRRAQAQPDEQLVQRQTDGPEPHRSHVKRQNDQGRRGQPRSQGEKKRMKIDD